MANFFTRALDRITPWNRGGEVQRRQKSQQRQQRKKRPEDPTNYSSAPTTLSVTNNPGNPATQQKLRVERPENLFADLNTSLRVPSALKPVNPLVNNDVSSMPMPSPGDVIKPQLKVGVAPAQNLRTPTGVVVQRNPNLRTDAPQFVPKPKQSLGNRFRDIFDTNTESDKYRRAEGNRRAIDAGKPEEVKDLTLKRQGNIISKTPVVGTVTKMLNTGAGQIAQAPAVVGGQFATSEYSAATQELLAAQRSGDRSRIAAAKQRASNAVNRLDDYNRQQDAASSMFQKNDGGLFNAGTLYDEEGAKRGDIKTGLKDVVLPIAVAGADIYTLGQGAVIGQALKQGVGKTALKTAAPAITRASAGNFFSGAGGTVSEGGNAKDAAKAGLLSSLFGLVPDVGLPLIGKSFTNRVLPKIMRGKNVNPADVVEEIDDAALSASAEAANQALKPKPISVRAETDIPIKSPLDPGVNVPIAVKPRPLGEPIKEISGDFGFKPMKQLQQIRVDAQRAQANDFNAATSAPDRAVDGVFPRQPEAPYSLDSTAVKGSQDEAIDGYAAMLKDLGQGNGVDMVRTFDGYKRVSNNYRSPGVSSGRMTNQAWRDQAEAELKAGRGEPGAQKAFDDAQDPEVQALLARGDQTQDAPIGAPIRVKEATSIPVVDRTEVPVGLPEKPGTVRATIQTAPNEARTEAVANAPVVARPDAQLPAEVQAVLDDPKRFSKRDNTAAAVERIDNASPTRQSEEFAPTGQFDVGRKGNAYEKANAGAERQLGQREMAERSAEDLASEIGQKNKLDPGDARRITAAKQNLLDADPENARGSEVFRLLDRAEKAGRTRAAQIMALIPRTVRKTSTAETLVNRWDNKLGKALDDPSKITADYLRTVQTATAKFTDARDNASKLEEQWKNTKSDADYKAWERAHNDARKADTDAKMAEVQVAQRVLKGQRGANVTKILDDMKKEANVNSMDIVSANMLSGIATGFRNTFGSWVAGVENLIGANIRAKITNKIFDENVGGYDREAARMGRKIGVTKFFGDAKRRADVGGKNPFEQAKNWATTINSGGESSIQSQVYSRLGKYYKNQFDSEGITKQQLDQRMRHAMLTDPDGMNDVFTDAVVKASGLTGLFEKGQTIEKGITDFIGQKTNSRIAQTGSRLLMRLAVGFPTATTNFLYQSGKRLTVGVPSFIESGAKIVAGDKAGAARAFDNALKEFGSGNAILGLGVALGSSGSISGAYPSDPAERERWAREGISENSIKINGNWHAIPQGAGMLGLPLLTGAAIGRDGEQGLKEMYNPKNLSKLLPTEQLHNFLSMASGDDDKPQGVKNFLASSVRAATPVGALINQISRSFDETKNDSTTKDFWSNVVDQIGGGIPGVNNAMNIPDKLDSDGNPIKNPNALPLALGAGSAEQKGGVERSGALQDEVDSQLKGLDDLGILGDKNLEGVLEGKDLEAYKKMQSGKKLNEDEVKKIKEGFVKGVSSEGTDTAYLERGQYDTNLAVLKLKRDLMDNDKTVKPSSLKDIDTAIKRGEVYKTDEIPYEIIDAYKSTGVKDWRKMGNPESDEYDPDMYQKLFDIDERMTKAGVSYKEGALDKNKFTAKEVKGKGSRGRGGGGGGRGGRGGGLSASEMSSDFGRLKDGYGAPSVQQYETIDQRSGSVPVIKTVRPNIVHNIGSSR